MISEKKDRHIVIIGGGYAGVAAAKELYQNEIPFTLLEAQKRVGGRVQSQDTNMGFHVELGAQWIGTEQKEITKWVDTLFIQESSFGTSKTNQQGKPVNWIDGVKEYQNNDSLVFRGVKWYIDRKASKIPFPGELIAKKNQNQDARSLASLFKWWKFVLGQKNFIMVNRAVEISFATDASRMSVLSALYNVKGAGGVSKLIDVEGGAQESFLPAGFQNLLEKIAEPFKHHVNCSDPATEVTQSDSGKVIVKTETGRIFNADRVIVAVCPILLVPRDTYPKIEPKIKFTPTLSKERIGLIGKLALGTPIKCQVIFERPFWRDAPYFYSGQIFTDRFPFAASYDCSPFDGAGPGVLTVFIKEKTKGDFVSLAYEKQKQVIREEISRCFDEIKDIPEIINLYLHKWDESNEFAPGGYACGYPPGVYSQYGDLLKRPEGKIHWACSETADEWYGFMEGAILSGIRAANEVMAALNPYSKE